MHVRRRVVIYVIGWSATLAASMAMGGCAGGGLLASDRIDVKMYGTAERPAELDRLNVFVGSWRAVTDESDRRSGATTRTESESTTRWAAGDRYLVTEARRTDGTNARSESLTVTTWDPDRRIYRQWSFDSSGTVVAGEDWAYNAGDDSWRLTRQGENGRVEGVIRFSEGGREMRMTYNVVGRGPQGIIASGTAVATRTN